ncbi:amidohydrolase family protein [Pigmentiphaga soli]|uniref:Amidohydrolase family protein n=1 Tax=Pigmentiphaga soli TaxID=1007095 RepID=A0ABP8GE02_9BURK
MKQTSLSAIPEETGLAADPAALAGGCDCHTHVFADPGDFPFAPTRSYTPQTAEAAQLAAHLRALGLGRVVVVQPSVYGLDNGATLHAIETLGRASARGVAGIDVERVTDAELDRLHAGGMRGIRLNLETDGIASAEEGRRLLEAAARRVGGRGWHVQIHARLALIAGLADAMPTLGVPVVLDHFGGTRASTSPAHPDFVRLLAAVRSGAVYVKLSAGHLCAIRNDDFSPLQPLVRALVDARADRMVWGSDWPHPNPGAGVPAHQPCPPHRVDDRAALAALRRSVADDAVFRQIMVSNPERLYGFEHYEHRQEIAP